MNKIAYFLFDATDSIQSQQNNETMKKKLSTLKDGNSLLFSHLLSDVATVIAQTW